MRHVDTLESRRLLSTQVVVDLSGDGVRPSDFVTYGGGVAFQGHAAATGVELWTSDGTAAGTRLLVDLESGVGSSNATPVAAIGKALLFTTRTQSEGFALWSTFGTARTTQRILSLSYGIVSDRLGAFAWLGDALLFRTSPGDLYRTDGTVRGTYRLAHGRPQVDLRNAGDVRTAGRYAYFSYKSFVDTYDTVLARSDGARNQIETFTQIDGQLSGEAAGATFVLPSRSHDGQGLYAIDEAGEPTLLRAFASVRVLRNSVAGSVVYAIGQTTRGVVPQLYRCDGRTVTPLTRFTSAVLNTATITRVTADGVYFTDGGSTLYVVGRREMVVRRLAVVPADARGRAGVIDDLAIARDGTVFLRRTGRGGSTLFRFAASGLRDLGPIDPRAMLATAGTTAFFARDDGTGFSELFTAGVRGRRAIQQTALAGSPASSGVQSFVPLAGGILATAATMGDRTGADRTTVPSLTTAFLLRDGRVTQLGRYDTAVNIFRGEFFTHAYAAGDVAFFSVSRVPVGGGTDTADLYRTDGTAAGTRLVATDVGQHPLYLGRAGGFAFFGKQESKIVVALPLTGRSGPVASTLDVAPSGDAVVAGGKLYVQCGVNRIIEFDGRTGAARDLNIGAHLPRGSVQQYLQAWHDQLVIVAQRGTVCEAFLLAGDTLTPAGAFTTARGYAILGGPAVSADDELLVLLGGRGAATQLFRVDPAANTAALVTVFSIIGPLRFLDSGQPVAAAPWARGRFSDKLLLAAGRYGEYGVYLADGASPAVRRIEGVEAASAFVAGDTIYSLSAESLIQTRGDRPVQIAPRGDQPTAVTVINEKPYFVANSPVGREILTYRYQPKRFSGRVFRDADGDGVPGSGEAGLGGWRVFIDGNGDGVFNSDEHSVLTDVAGDYAFDDLPAGKYLLAVIPPAGTVATTPTVFSVGLKSDGRALRNFGIKPLPNQ